MTPEYDDAEGHLATLKNKKAGDRNLEAIQK